MDLDIEHKEELKQFAVQLNGEKAYLKYEEKDDDKLDFTETFVPEEHRDKGLAGKIVKKGLEYAKENELEVIPSCPFVESYIDEHEEYRDLVSKS